VSQYDGKGHRQVSLDVVQIAVADAGGGDADCHLSPPGGLQFHGLDGEWLTHLVEHGGAHGRSS